MLSSCGNLRTVNCKLLSIDCQRSLCEERTQNKRASKPDCQHDMRAASGAGVGKQAKRGTVISIRSRHCSQSRTYVHFLSDLYLRLWFASTYLNIKICLKVLLVFFWERQYLKFSMSFCVLCGFPTFILMDLKQSLQVSQTGRPPFN